MNTAADHQRTRTTAAPPATTAKSSLGSLQAGRGIAALLVVLFHCNGLFNSGEYFKTSPFGRFFEFGDAGVYFFFVLSGFIIFHAHARDIGRRERIGTYLTRRVIRIYPLYLIVMAVVVPVYFVHPQFGGESNRSFWSVLSSLTLISDGTTVPILAVSWTLFHEVMFYAVFAAVIWNARIGAIILAGWVAVSACFLHTASARLGYFFSPLHLLFGFGILANLWLRAGRSVPAGLFAVAGTAGFFAIGMDRVYFGLIPSSLLPWAYGAAATVAVLGMARLEMAGRLRIPGWLLLTGDASYAIYLVHFPALSALAKVFSRVSILPPVVSFLIMAILAAVPGYLAYLLIERPLGARLKTSLGRSTRVPTSARTKERAIDLQQPPVVLIDKGGRDVP